VDDRVHEAQRRWVIRRSVALLGLALTLIIGGFLGAFGGDLYGRLTSDASPPSVSTQLEAFKTDAARDGWFATASVAAQLHGTGKLSRILVLRHRVAPLMFGGAGSTVPTEEFSDELRIYDLDDDRFRLSYRFRPQSRPGPDGAPPLTYHFRVHAVADLDADGADEILGSWHDDTERPVLISWDDIDEEYRLDPLVSPELPPGEYYNVSRPSLVAARDHLAAQQRLRYLRAERLEDVHDPTAGFRSYALEDFFAVRDAEAAVILVGAYIVDGEPMTGELEARSLGFEKPRATAVRCPSRHPVLFLVPRLSTFADAMREAWNRERRRFHCF
jgi:hypothetical protein